MAEVGPSRKGRHDVSLTSLRPALQADKEIVTIRRLKAEVDYVLPAGPEAPSHAWHQHKSPGAPDAVQIQPRLVTAWIWRGITDELAVAVRVQWEGEAMVRRRNDPYPLPVSWTAAEASLADGRDVLMRWRGCRPAGSWRWVRPGRATQY